MEHELDMFPEHLRHCIKDGVMNSWDFYNHIERLLEENCIKPGETLPDPEIFKSVYNLNSTIIIRKTYRNISFEHRIRHNKKFDVWIVEDRNKWYEKRYGCVFFQVNPKKQMEN